MVAGPDAIGTATDHPLAGLQLGLLRNVRETPGPGGGQDHQTYPEMSVVHEAQFAPTHHKTTEIGRAHV